MESPPFLSNGECIGLYIWHRGKPMIKTLTTTSSRRAVLVGLGALLVGYYAAFGARVNAAEEARVIPSYTSNGLVAPAQGSEEVAVLAGGCFWGVQGVFQHVKGVTSAVSGHAGGEK